MRQTLFRIPLDGPWTIGPWEVPGFGFGIVLAVWIALAVWWLVRHRRDLTLGPELFVPAAVWLVMAVGIVALPTIVQREATQTIRAASVPIDAGAPSVAAYMARGRAHLERREYAAALDDFRAASRLDPESAEPHRDIAWVRATCPDASFRDGPEAVAEAQKASERAGPRDSVTLDVLAAAHAEAGDFPAAITAAKKAARLANDAQDATGARLPGIRQRLAGYERGVAWREPTTRKALPVYGYGFLLFVGFLVAGITATRRAKSVGIPAETVWDVGLWGFFSGIAGARLFYVIQYPDRVFAGREGIGKVVAVFNLPDGGLVLYGGVILGVLAVILYCRRRGLNVLLLGDILVPALFVGVAFGRMGCFLNGCCYGDRCELPWRVAFPAGSVPDSALVNRGFQAADEVIHRIALHPTQIYSAIDGLILAFVTASYFRCRPRDGAVVLLGLVCYPITRFFIEYLRSDEPPVVFTVRTLLFWGQEVTRLHTPFTISQWVSVWALLGAAVYYAWWRRRENPARADVRVATRR